LSNQKLVFTICVFFYWIHLTNLFDRRLLKQWTYLTSSGEAGQNIEFNISI